MSDTLFRLPHIAARLFDQPLAIEASKLHVIAAVLAPQLGVVLTGLPEVSLPQVQARATSGPQRDPDLPYVVHQETALIPVFGTLVQRSGFMEAESGLTSYAQLRSAVEAALEDDAVASLLLHIDSGGGEAMGLADFVTFLADAGQQKPLTTFTDGTAASAAYAIFSAGSRRIASQDAVLGSIGVRMLHVDQSARNDAQGLVVTEFFAGARKLDFSPHQSLTKDKRTALQAIVDTYYDMLTAQVAAQLGMTQRQIQSTEAGLFVGQQAIAAGLAQDMGTLDRVLSSSFSASRPVAARASTELRRVVTMSAITTIAGLEAVYPELVSTLRTEARTAATQAAEARLTEALTAATRAEQTRLTAVHETALTAASTAATTAERARIQEILALAPLGCDTLATECAFTAPCSAADAAKQFLAHQKTLGPERLAKLRADAPDPVAPLSAPTPDAAGAPTAGELLMAQAAERRNAERRARQGTLTAVPNARH